MTDPFPIRVIGEDEFAAFYEVGEHAFNSSRPADQAMAYERATFEFDRSLAACDGDRLVGTAGAYSFSMTVPGATSRVAGVTAVSVLPSHRRRGILSSLIRRQFADVRSRGEPVAALFASESGIYGRFGYGLASLESRFAIRRGEGALLRDSPAEPGLRLRIADPQDARHDLAAVYDIERQRRPGLWARDDRWWGSVLHDPEYMREGAAPLRCMIAEDGSGQRSSRGYALYAVKSTWGEDGLPAGVIHVREVMTADPAATAAIWNDLLTRDLTGELVARMRPVDDPLLHLLADPRRARSQVSDGLWTRLVDVPAALAQRRYACPVEVVIAVTDELCPWNEGRWRLVAAGETSPATRGTAAAPALAAPALAAGVPASCEPTTDPPDVTLPVRALGAVYLGGTRLGALAAAGQVSESRPGAVAALSAAMSWDPAPWCPMIF